MGGEMTLVRLLCLVLLVSPFGALDARAHALDPGYVDLRQIGGDTWQVFWRKPDVQGAPMEINALLPETCAPRSGPPPRTDGRAWIASWTAVCPDGLAGRPVVIGGLDRQATDVLVRVQRRDRPPTTHRLTPDRPSFIPPADPSPMAVFGTYGVLGFDHILEGWDHLLFVLALVLLIPDTWRLVGTITAFTIAHSITLALASLGHIAVPGPPVEAIIALSVVFLAVELLKRKEGQPRLSERAPWIIAFAFGLLHGLGFAGALKDIGLPDTDIAVALLAFNLGVEAGQLAFVTLLLVTGFVVRRLVIRRMPPRLALQRRGAAVSAYVIGSVATYWLAERLAGF